MIHSYQYCKAHFDEPGIVAEVKDFLVKIKGLPGAMIGEGVAFKSGEYGRVMEIERELIEVLVFTRTPLSVGTLAARSGSLLEVTAGTGLLGTTVNALGHLISGEKRKSKKPYEMLVEAKPSGIWSRKKISRFFPTGVAVVDLLLPLGMGQRELIIGDRKTGKTSFILRTMLSAAQAGTICLYAGIGKRKSEIKALEDFLRSRKVLKNCILVAADSYSSPAEIFLCPSTALALAEYFRDQGRDVLVILDDLTTHAKYYREISLLLGAFPGRESYPGDIFHLQSKILERAGCFEIKKKEVAITCLPIAESVGGDMTGYIQTNLMSMTDGHLYFDSDLFASGRRPAINSFLSVTRVGRQTQSALVRDLNSKVLTLLKKYEDLQKFLRFGPELTPEIKNTLLLGEKVLSFFNQLEIEIVPFRLQVILISFLWLGYWEGKDLSQLKKLNQKITITKLIDRLIAKSQTFTELNNAVEQNKEKLLRLVIPTK